MSGAEVIAYGVGGWPLIYASDMTHAWSAVVGFVGPWFTPGFGMVLGVGLVFVLVFSLLRLVKR